VTAIFFATGVKHEYHTRLEASYLAAIAHIHLRAIKGMRAEALPLPLELDVCTLDWICVFITIRSHVAEPESSKPLWFRGAIVLACIRLHLRVAS